MAIIAGVLVVFADVGDVIKEVIVVVGAVVIVNLVLVESDVAAVVIDVRW